MSQRTHSAVSSMPAIEAEFSRATRREFTGLSLLGGVDDAALEEVLVLLGAGVAAVIGTVDGTVGVFNADAVLHLVDDDATLKAGVCSTFMVSKVTYSQNAKSSLQSDWETTAFCGGVSLYKYIGIRKFHCCTFSLRA